MQQASNGKRCRPDDDVAPAFRKKATTNGIAPQVSIIDFKVEQSQSRRATCYGCKGRIKCGDTRIKAPDHDDEEIEMFFAQKPFHWFHVNCFASLRIDLGWAHKCGDQLPGFNRLTSDQQDHVRKSIPKIVDENEQSGRKPGRVYGLANTRANTGKSFNSEVKRTPIPITDSDSEASIHILKMQYDIDR